MSSRSARHATETPPPPPTVVRGGTVHDGRGGGGVTADVVLADGVVTAIVAPGTAEVVGAREVDASGCGVTPRYVRRNPAAVRTVLVNGHTAWEGDEPGPGLGEVAMGRLRRPVDRPLARSPGGP